MNRQYRLLILLVTVVVFVTGCGEFDRNAEEKKIKIVVLGDKENFYPDFELAVNDAVGDLQNEYGDLKYDFEVVFYDDDDDYNKGMQYVDAAVKDSEVTAVIGSVNMEINKTAAKMCEENGKIFVTPYFLYDSVFQDNQYSMVFSMCISARNVGRLLRNAAVKTTAEKWAVCTSDTIFEMEETRGFVFDEQDGVTVIDCVDIDDLINNFDNVLNRWKLLGIEGLVMFPEDDEGFDILKKIKAVIPDLTAAGDTAFDNSALLDNDEELRSIMSGFIMADEFYFPERMTPDREREYIALSDRYSLNHEGYIDIWYFQGYNAVRMIGDTAVKAETDDPETIAKTLHEEGYDGYVQSFKFQKNGLSESELDYYGIMNDDGYFEIKYLDE